MEELSRAVAAGRWQKSPGRAQARLQVDSADCRGPHYELEDAALPSLAGIQWARQPALPSERVGFKVPLLWVLITRSTRGGSCRDSRVEELTNLRHVRFLRLRSSR